MFSRGHKLLRHNFFTLNILICTLSVVLRGGARDEALLPFTFDAHLCVRFTCSLPCGKAIESRQNVKYSRRNGTC